MNFEGIKGKLKSFWNWVKGNARCGKCGSNETKIIQSDFIKTEQRWETDWSCPKGANGLRPQNVFNISYYDTLWKCQKCSTNTKTIEIKKYRA